MEKRRDAAASLAGQCVDNKSIWLSTEHTTVRAMNYRRENSTMFLYSFWSTTLDISQIFLEIAVFRY